MPWPTIERTSIANLRMARKCWQWFFAALFMAADSRLNLFADGLLPIDRQESH